MSWIGIAIALPSLALLSVVALGLFGTPGRLQPLFAILRGALQLALLSIVLGGLITDLRWIILGLVVMFAAAVIVAGRRVRGGRRGLLKVAAAMAGGCLLAGGIVFGSGALPVTGRYLLAFAGILIGNAMTTATLTGRGFRMTVLDHWDEVEGWLALGATPRQATLDLARRAAHSALVPLVDQTKTTGLVVLPGAFVGAIFGGLSPLQAGVFQILVLTALIGSGSVISTLLLVLVGPVRQKPYDEYGAATGAS
ncbi:ABC transporter permease [Galbitalea soli]|uniref:ABC transporter permease n=1 Tax=Galbitalea soli TaxID=1268042 RepID=A0A7C9TN20_9MICO|nr:ABC transporter permease [Galbitalea soli]NEM90097.1 ABC transporter permease [Galbitalea soli]NYJ30804.1 putative ABC transport system permease protein [Galbitalea soli]